MAADPFSTTGLFTWVLDHLWAPVAGMIMAVWTHLGARFKKLDKDKLDKEDFETWCRRHEDRFAEHVARTEKQNEDRRLTEIKLFDKMDDIRNLIFERRSERRSGD